MREQLYKKLQRDQQKQQQQPTEYPCARRRLPTTFIRTHWTTQNEREYVPPPVQFQTHHSPKARTPVPRNEISNALNNVLTIIKIFELRCHCYYSIIIMDEYQEDAWHLVCSPEALTEFIWKCMLIALQTPKHLARVTASAARQWPSERVGRVSAKEKVGWTGIHSHWMRVAEESLSECLFRCASVKSLSWIE